MMKRHIALFFALFLVACGESDQANAGDEGLYAPVAPAGSAFVRFMNVSPQPLDTKIKNKEYGAVNSGEVSPYYVVPQGDVAIMIGDKTLNKAVTEKNYYTAYFNGVSAAVIDDAGVTNPAKAVLALYNVGEVAQAIDLKAKAGAVDVVKGVTKGATGSRDINPVKIDLSVAGEGMEAITLEPIIMERGFHYSIVFDGKKAFIATASTDTRK